MLLAAGVTAFIVIFYGIYGNTQEPEAFGHSAIGWMVRRWSGAAGDFAHGWLIPFVSGYLVWRKRDALRRTPKSVCGPGLMVVGAAVLLHWVGMQTQLVRLSLFSLIGLLWGLTLYLWGWRVAKQVMFPAAYLIFCIPLSFLDGLTLPLRFFVTNSSVVLLNGLGIVTRNWGTAILAGAEGLIKVDVADPCSGLRSLLSLSAITALYGYISQTNWIKQWLVFLSAMPLAVAGNILRVVSIVVISDLAGIEKGMQFSHDYSGYVVFITAVLLMMGLGVMLRRIGPRAGDVAGGARPVPGQEE